VCESLPVPALEGLNFRTQTAPCRVDPPNAEIRRTHSREVKIVGIYTFRTISLTRGIRADFLFSYIAGKCGPQAFQFCACSGRAGSLRRASPTRPLVLRNNPDVKIVVPNAAILPRDFASPSKSEFRCGNNSYGISLVALTLRAVPLE
jgi:hypothetical protein